jgi:hypothetical protein
MTAKDELKSYTLSPEELEIMLSADYGGKLQPVDRAKLSKQKQQKANVAAYKARFAKPKT